VKKNHIEICQRNFFVRINRPFIFLQITALVVKTKGLSYEFAVVAIRDCVELSYTISPTKLVWVNQTLNNERLSSETSTLFTISTPCNELLDCLIDSV
jgi:hypothetical protein